MTISVTVTAVFLQHYMQCRIYL